MKEINLSELEEAVKEKEAVINEPVEVTQMIRFAAQEAMDAANNGNVTILTDYDADGITSAYIMEKLIKSVNPECNVIVGCNDRRGSYGLSPASPYLQKSNDTMRYIVCDMGSNQLELARKFLGDDVIIFDHHIIDDDKTRSEFASFEPLTNNVCLCNPHAFNADDKNNAQYCSAGLAYRAYQIVQEISKEKKLPFHTTEKQDNTVAVMACIGTATDMVDVFDVNGYNRYILKDGLQRIDNADETNLDFVIGYMLEMCGTSDEITAHQLAFNTGAFLNSASRMSEIIGANGAQIMYDAITADESKSDTYFKLNELMSYNQQRKGLISQLTSEQAYDQFIYEHRFGQNANDNIGVYQLPDDVPAAFAGLVASKLTEATDKAIICLTYNTEKGYYTGSGRNAASNETAIKTFMDEALKDEIESDSGFDIEYGGHEDAVGISALNDIIKFKELIDKSKDKIITKNEDEKQLLSMSISDISDPETLKRLQAIEPTGIGFQLPAVHIQGIETYRDGLFKANNEHWKTIKVKDTETKTVISVADWSYSPEKYPQTGKKGNEISFLAEIGISDYKGQHVELSAKFDRLFLQERQLEAEQEKVSKSKNPAVSKEYN